MFFVSVALELLRCTRRATAEPILANIIISKEINVVFLFFFLGTGGASTLFNIVFKTVSSPSSVFDWGKRVVNKIVVSSSSKYSGEDKSLFISSSFISG